ncbi:YceI family protein [Solimonas sp. K1W22B-7]|uniref:YceI family protein n=1 Tax=Solimonas sp. K1W22B-7 TaxID=2303331 RepID=UPI000E3310C0|nr:YceI family protein [Solimonas sp. K1W22B-7]AXQ31548.1 YceI family protein [Solimonas sp. K1W22B-7]
MKLLLAALLSLSTLTAQAAPRTLDPTRSEITFSVKQMGVAVDGRFKRFEAQLAFDAAKPETSSAAITVDIASVDAGSDEADSTALERAWLDKAGFPKALFKSSSVRALGAGKYEAKGLLTIKGRPREITVPFTATEQAGGATLLSGQISIRRTDFGIGGGEWNEGDLVANEVPVKFKLMLAPAR